MPYKTINYESKQLYQMAEEYWTKDGVIHGYVDVDEEYDRKKENNVPVLFIKKFISSNEVLKG